MYILSPNYSRFHFFFSPPAAGLTNRGPVRDSDPGAPLLGGFSGARDKNVSTNFPTFDFLSLAHPACA